MLAVCSWSDFWSKFLIDFFLFGNLYFTFLWQGFITPLSFKEVVFKILGKSKVGKLSLQSFSYKNNFFLDISKPFESNFWKLLEYGRETIDLTSYRNIYPAYQTSAVSLINVFITFRQGCGNFTMWSWIVHILSSLQSRRNVLILMSTRRCKIEVEVTTLRQRWSSVMKICRLSIDVVKT